MRKLSQKAIKRIEVDATKQISAYNRLMIQDASGEYVWSADELQQIETLVMALKENRMFRVFGGEVSILDRSIKEHDSDAKTIVSWSHDWFKTSVHGKLVCAELRRRMAARIKAFKLAGLSVCEVVAKVSN